jgi:LacI family transcriptional regulator
MARQPSTSSRRRRPTIIDVAQAVGVSPATVSRVVNRSKPVSPEIADKVLQAVEDLGYRPNPAAQGLLRGASHTIAVVVPDLSNPYFAEILKGVTAAASERQYRTLVADSNEDVDQELDAAHELLRWVDGVVLCSPRMPAAQLRRLADEAPRIVLVNRVMPRGLAPAVTVDFASGMRAICRHLIDLGHREVAYLSGPPAAWSEAQRHRELRKAAANGLTVHEIPCGSSSDAGHAAVDAALAVRPSALIAFSDYVALGALARLDELGVAVPDDVSLIGFDDLPFGELVRPRLTTVSVEEAQLGRLSLERLLDAEPSHTLTTVPATLMVRDSTAAPSAARRRSTASKRTTVA